jgi:hypothetical protein
MIIQLIGLIVFHLRVVSTEPPMKSEACFKNLGTKEYFGSTEQVRELQQETTRKSVKACPRIGFRIALPTHSTLVVYDRPVGMIIRTGKWKGQAATQWELWSGVTPAKFRTDDPDDGFDAGVYHQGRAAELLVPSSTRQYLRQLGVR